MENVIDDVVSNIADTESTQKGPEMMLNEKGDFKMPNLEEFIKMLEHMDGMSDEEKDQLKNEVLRNSMRGRKMDVGFSDYLVFLTMVIIMASVFVFFGYKLYLSLTEKERKREEKLKAKQAKKKK
ncbi:uncharacterized protein LOC131439065 isoform X2 [Malaya genurostris]|uniref:uncharacterized protein LOC131439065 isoform X2 n=1 Tax=Malaya genurostris TaxID=325434 RepID=UPI0026F3CF82|nr:uncharacterized protein LOC131439065 isoform X2 [Malaya genurostris]